MHIMNMPMTAVSIPTRYAPFVIFGVSAPKEKAILSGTCQLYKVKMIYAQYKRIERRENARLDGILKKIGR